MADELTRYRARRDFDATPEPAAGQTTAPAPGRARFVVQEHHATRLHWDLRLERDGVLASWAIPNGIPPTPRENRLAVHTEDHPLRYLDFHGEIPAGQYGAGTMSIWDRGTYDAHAFVDDKVEVTFHGERLNGRYGLFPIGRRADGSGGVNDWMIHRMDPPARLPDGRERALMPERVRPMLAGAGDPPPDASRYAYEVKWDGVRAIAYLKPGRLRLESRNLNEITSSYPEVRGILDDLGMREAVLDGEIVAFDADGRPSFERLQARMHVTAPNQVRRLRRSRPVVYAIFDLLYLDGESLLALPYAQRRERLDGLGLSGPAWRVPAASIGAGASLLAATARQGLEGVVAKRLDSRYEPGRRTGAWIKLKHLHRQELVICGWLPGEGRRTDRIGALLMGYHDDGGLRYAGRVGTGFTERTLAQLGDALAPLRTEASPYAVAPRLPRNAVFVEPRLVAEVEFREWTADGVMRAPSFKGLRVDKPAIAVVREAPTSDPSATTGIGGETSATPEGTFGEVTRRPDGAIGVVVDGRALKLTNWDKVLFAQTGFTKGDLIAYYARIAPAALPHLADRPLTLKRYPDGVDRPHFYEKQAPSHRPAWVQTVRVADVDYTLCQDLPTLVWLANLADVELHTSLSLRGDPGTPTMLVFDLDPGEPAALPECCQVALVLHGMFAALRLDCCAKTSGSKGMQVHVPLNTPVTYGQTKPFARRVAELLAQRLPELVVSRMTRRLRPGRVLVDWSQNDRHKTTVNVYSLRARPTPTVSAPVSWDEVSDCRDSGDGGRLTFGPDQALARVARDGDRFASLLSTRQELPRG